VTGNVQSVVMKEYCLPSEGNIGIEIARCNENSKMMCSEVISGTTAMKQHLYVLSL
jgi:hypothetical protein